MRPVAVTLPPTPPPLDDGDGDGPPCNSNEPTFSDLTDPSNNDEDKEDDEHPPPDDGDGHGPPCNSNEPTLTDLTDPSNNDEDKEDDESLFIPWVGSTYDDWERCIKAADGTCFSASCLGFNWAPNRKEPNQQIPLVVLKSLKVSCISQAGKERLEELTEWMNDENVNAFLNHANNVQKHPDLVPRFGYRDKSYFVFETHWRDFVLKDGAEAIRKWYDETILDHDLLIFPICDVGHWSVIIVVNPGLMDEDFDKLEESSRCPGLIHMDNLRSHKTEEVKREVCDVLDHMWSTYRVGKINAANLRCCKPKIIRQRDNFTCGMYLLHNTAMFLNIRNDNFLKSDFEEDFDNKVTLKVRLFNKTQKMVLEERERLAHYYDEILRIRAPPAETASTELSVSPPPPPPPAAAAAAEPSGIETYLAATAPVKSSALTAPPELSISPPPPPPPPPPAAAAAAPKTKAEMRKVNATRKTAQRRSNHYRIQYHDYLKSSAGINFTQLKQPEEGEYWSGDRSSGKFIKFQQLTGPFEVKMYGTNGKPGETITAVMTNDKNHYMPIDYARVKRLGRKNRKNLNNQVTCGIWYHNQITGFIKFDNENLKWCRVQWQPGVEQWVDERAADSVIKNNARKRTAPDRLSGDEKGQLTDKKMKEGSDGAFSDKGLEISLRLREEYFTTKNPNSGKTTLWCENPNLERLVQHGEFHRAIEYTKVLSQSDPSKRLRNETAFQNNDPIPWKMADKKYKRLDEFKPCIHLLIVNLAFECLSGRRDSHLNPHLIKQHLIKQQKMKTTWKKPKRDKCLVPGCDTFAHTAHKPYCIKHSTKERKLCIDCNRNQRRHVGGRCNLCHTKYYADKPDELERMRFCYYCPARRCRELGGLCTGCSNDPAIKAKWQREKMMKKKKKNVEGSN